MDSIGNVLASLNAIAANVKDERKELNVGRTATSMAKMGYTFNEDTLELVKTYCSGIGICLSGDVGTGKSHFFYCLGIPAINLKVAQGKTLQEITRALDSYQDCEILIDDVGLENKDYKSFGTAVGLVDYIVEKRMDSSAPTHMTTNLKPEQLQEQYGDRLVDRITQLCEWHELHGESHRDPTNAKRKDAWFADFFLGRKWELCAKCCGWYDCDERKCMKGKTHEPRAYVRQGYSPEPSCPFYN